MTQLNCAFLEEVLPSNPQILDNIGVLSLGGGVRYGVLLTREKEGLFMSVID